MITLSTGFMVALLIQRFARALHSAPRTGSVQAHRRRLPRRRAECDYAPVLDAVARQVRSGSSLTNAIIDEADDTTPLAGVAERISRGASLTESFGDLAVLDDADLALTVQVMTACAHLGGQVAATLDDAAAVLRERSAARAERVAHGSQARLSARVLTVVPIGFAVWSAIASQRTRAVYVSSIAGAVCAILGLALNLVGWLWMKRIIE